MKRSKMKMHLFRAVAVAIPLAVGTSRLFAQGPGQFGVLVPDSSIEQPGDRGQRAHTNHVISLRGAGPEFGSSSPTGMTPPKLRTAYGVPSTGGSGAIAIVDAYDYPTALQDFNVFSSQSGWGLATEPSTNPLADTNRVFEVVYATGTVPRGNCGWAQEAALDIEWAHAMAPSAKIYLVEAASNSFTDLMQAVDVAASLPGVMQVSLSWGGSEFSGETAYDFHFSNPAGVTFFAASGDSGGQTIYPSVSQYVVAAGGTSLKLNSNNTIKSESGWTGSGGGPSKYVIRPAFQNVLPGTINGVNLNGMRAVPDFSFDADPNTGVSVYDSTRCQGSSGWLVFGGTSVSSPSLSGISNLTRTLNQTTTNELTLLYSNYPNDGSDFNDITTGTAGSYSAATGYDLVTGLGSNKGTSGK